MKFKLLVIKQISHGDETAAQGIVSNIVIMWMVTNGDYPYCGEYWVMHGIVESTCCTPETNTLYVNFTWMK